MGCLPIFLLPGFFVVDFGYHTIGVPVDKEQRTDIFRWLVEIRVLISSGDGG